MRTSSSSASTTWTGKELPRQGVKETRVKELTYLRALDENEKVDERAAVTKYNVTSVDTQVGKH